MDAAACSSEPPSAAWRSRPDRCSSWTAAGRDAPAVLLRTARRADRRGRQAARGDHRRCAAAARARRPRPSPPCRWSRGAWGRRRDEPRRSRRAAGATCPPRAARSRRPSTRPTSMSSRTWTRWSRSGRASGPGFVYGRYGTANHTMLEDLVAALEGAERRGLRLGHGGDDRAPLRPLRGGRPSRRRARPLRLDGRLSRATRAGGSASPRSSSTRRMRRRILAALRDNTRAVFVEAISNPLLRLVDLPAIAGELSQRSASS